MQDDQFERVGRVISRVTRRMQVLGIRADPRDLEQEGWRLALEILERDSFDPLRSDNFDGWLYQALLRQLGNWYARTSSAASLTKRAAEDGTARVTRAVASVTPLGTLRARGAPEDDDDAPDWTTSALRTEPPQERSLLLSEVTAGRGGWDARFMRAVMGCLDGAPVSRQQAYELVIRHYGLAGEEATSTKDLAEMTGLDRGKVTSVLSRFQNAARADVTLHTLLREIRCTWI